MTTYVEVNETVQYSQYLVSTTLDGNDYPEYIAEALPGATVSDNFWRIKKLTYVARSPSGYQVASVLWASSNAKLDKNFSGYLDYNYG